MFYNYKFLLLYINRLIFNNNIDDEIPESYNNLSELKHV